MTPKYTFQVFILSCLICLMGCGKDIDQFIPDPPITLTGNIDRFFEEAREDITQTTTINIDFPTAVVTPRKTVLIFQPKSLIDASGNIATGFVDIKILELLTKGEILLYGIPTNSDSKLLSSGGEFYITAIQGTTNLKLRPGMPVRILTDVSGTPEERMELFYAELEYDLVRDDTIYAWQEADNNPNTWNNIDVTEWVALADSQQIITGFGYECFSDSLDWINFDVFNNISPINQTNVCVTLPEAYGNVNTMTFIVFNETQSVVALPGNPVSRQFCNYYNGNLTYGLPIGAEVSILVISERGPGNYFSAFTETELPSEDLELTLIPEATTLAEIKDVIRFF